MNSITNRENDSLNLRELYRLAFLRLPDPVVLVRPDEIIQDCSESFCLRLGKAREEVVNHNLFSLKDCQSAEKCKAAFHCAVATRKSSCNEKSIFNADICCTSLFEPIVENETVTAVVGYFGDLSDTNEERSIVDLEFINCRTLLNMSGALVVALDREGHVLKINEKCCEILNDTEANIMGRDWFDSYVPEDSRLKTKTAFNQLLDGKTNAKETSVGLVISRNGERRTIEWKNRVLTTKSGKMLGMIGIGRDISLEEKLQIKLQEESNLQISAGQLTYALESTDIGMAVVNLESGGIKTNEKWDAIVGVYPGISSDDFRARIHPDDLEHHCKIADSFLRGDHPHIDCEYRYFHPTKGYIWIHAIMIALEKSKQGIISRYTVLHRDITKQKETELELINSHRLLRTLVDSIDGLIWIKDDRGKYRIVNEAFLKRFHISQQDIIGKDESFVFARKTTEAMQRVEERVAHSRKSENLQETLEDLRGRATPYIVNKVPIIEDSGVVGYCTVAYEITKLKEVENELKAHRDSLEVLVERQSGELDEATVRLQESEALFDQFAKNVDEVFWIIDLETEKFSYVSPAVEKVWGVPLSLLFDFSIHDRRLVHPNDRHLFDKTIKAVTVNGDNHSSTDYRIQRSDGEERWIRSQMYPVLNTAQEVYRLAVVSRDITQERLALTRERIHQEQLMLAGKMASLGVLVSGVAHEINNPNNFIMLNAPFLKRAWEDILPILSAYYRDNGDFRVVGLNFSSLGEDMLRLCDGIINGARRIERIVSDLKDYVKQDDSNLDSVVDINRVVTAAASLMQNMLSKRMTNFVVETCSAPLGVRGNFQRLEQVVINLIHNACDALETPDQEVRVTTNVLDEEHVTIVVFDRGCGIAPDDIQHLTDPFFTTKRDRGGTGLGLSISHSIIDAHHGVLRFESSRENGTTVTVILPQDHPKEGGTCL
jgi:PAS domain S-box-containing protein